MKKLKNLKLHHFGQAEMSKKEMNTLTGGTPVVGCGCGCSCPCLTSCGCKYAGEQEGPYDSYYGGSSTTANNSANNHQLKSNDSDSQNKSFSVSVMVQENNSYGAYPI
ncbi:TIGR04149 family rSAM-modified RiPP [Bacteroides bouchesdurhonensis]